MLILIGLIFNSLERVVVDEFNEDTWDELLDEAGVSGVYHSLGNYDDADAVALVNAAAAKLGKDPADILRWFGEHAIEHFRAKFPALFRRFDNTVEFVLSLNDIIHPQVKQLYTATNAPHFNLVHQDAESLTIEYVSKRQMCHLAEGLIIGCAGVYNEGVEVSQSSCCHRGDEQCHIVIQKLP